MNPETTHTSPDGAVLIVGAGAGVGAAVARRFSAGSGRPIALVARNAERLDTLADQLRDVGSPVETATADITDHDRLHSAIEELGSRVGPIGTLCFSPLPRVDLIKPLRQTSPQDMMAALALSVGGAHAATQAVLPQMLDRARGTLLFTTGSGAMYPNPARAVSAVQTIAERALIELLADDLVDTGVIVRHLTIAGGIGPGGPHTPESVADALWRLADGTATAALVEP